MRISSRKSHLALKNQTTAHTHTHETAYISFVMYHYWWALDFKISCTYEVLVVLLRHVCSVLHRLLYNVTPHTHTFVLPKKAYPLLLVRSVVLVGTEGEREAIKSAQSSS